MRSTGLVLSGLWPSRSRRTRAGGWRRWMQRPLPVGGLALAVVLVIVLEACGA